jgi:protein TonB
VLELEKQEIPAGRRAVRIGIALGVVLHVILFLIVFPEIDPKIYQIGNTQAKIYAVKQITFQPPKPQRQRRARRKPTAKTIPIPDPTPDDPEPLYDDTMDTPQLDFPDAELDGVLTIPEGPTGPSQGPIPISGNVKAPIRIFAPDPLYPEPARQARIQGVVILQTIIDTLGKVTHVKVLKGLPEGLTESAVAAVTQWKFNPATLNGEPVAVYYMVTISFSVQ